jgi:hypothetical protein
MDKIFILNSVEANEEEQAWRIEMSIELDKSQ